MIRSFSVLLAASLLALGAPASAATDFLETFTFQTLRFSFVPVGPDGESSVVEVFVRNLTIDGDNAVYLRHCIDGDADYCDFEMPGANDDGTVQAHEVATFQNFTTIGLRSVVKKVDELADMIQQKVLVDEKEGKNVLVTNVVFDGAEGATSSSAKVLAHIDAKITYENDASQKTHRIDVISLALKAQGFTYDSALLDLDGGGWHFQPDETKPELAKPSVNSKGYFSTQDQFENATAQGLALVVVKESAGKKKTPGPELGLVLVSLSLLAWVGRRRQ